MASLRNQDTILNVKITDDILNLEDVYRHHNEESSEITFIHVDGMVATWQDLTGFMLKQNC